MTVSTPDAARRAGLTYRQLSYWVSEGAIKPASGTGGSGNAYRFTERQVEILCQIAVVYRHIEGLDIGGPQTEFIARLWESLSATGTFNYTDGPLSITLPWPPDETLPEGA